MFVTLVFSLVYLYWAKIPHAPLGHRDVRGLLVARGMGGFFGGMLIRYLEHCCLADHRRSLWLLL